MKDTMQQNTIGTEAQPACYLCGRHGEVLYRDLKDRLFGAHGSWTFGQCPGSDCGLIWLDPMPTKDEIGKAYWAYNTHGQSNKPHRTLPGRIIRAIVRPIYTRLLGMQNEFKQYNCMYLDQMPPGRLLDVGCGSGTLLAHMRKLGWEVVGQEVDPAAAEYARKRWGVDVHVGSLETLDAHTEIFDAVIMNHVIEHAHDPIVLLSTCHRLLRHGGRLVVTTPNVASYGHHQFGASWRGLEPSRHLHLFTYETLVQIFKRAGFSHQHCWTTALNARTFAQYSRQPTGMTVDGRRIFAAIDELKDLSFQVAASLAFMKEKNSGEECVLVATKDNGEQANDNCQSL